MPLADEDMANLSLTVYAATRTLKVFTRRINILILIVVYALLGMGNLPEFIWFAIFIALLDWWEQSHLNKYLYSLIALWTRTV